MSSVLTNYVSVHVYIRTGSGRSTWTGTMKLNRFFSWEVCFINLMFTSPIVVGIKVFYVKCNQQKKKDKKQVNDLER